MQSSTPITGLQTTTIQYSLWHQKKMNFHTEQVKCSVITNSHTIAISNALTNSISQITSGYLNTSLERVFLD